MTTLKKLSMGAQPKIDAKKEIRKSITLKDILLKTLSSVFPEAGFYTT